MRAPTPGRIVLYKSLSGYIAPAIVVVTEQNLRSEGVRRFEETGGTDGIPPLSGPMHVHVVVFTAGLSSTEPRPPLEAPRGGTYQEWNVPPAADGDPDGQWERGTWGWPMVPPPAAPRESPRDRAIGEAAAAFAELARTATAALGEMVEESKQDRAEAEERRRRIEDERRRG